MKLSERMRDVLRAIAREDVHADGLQRYHGHVNQTLRALERRGLVEWPRLLKPQLTRDGRAELDGIELAESIDGREVMHSVAGDPHPPMTTDEFEAYLEEYVGDMP